MPRVLIYRTDLLPISETFILAQATALKSFQPRLIGLCRPERSLPVPEDSILLAGKPSFSTRVRKRLYWTTGIAPGFHRRAAQTAASLMHAHFGPDGVTAAHIAKKLRIPLIVTLHGYDVTPSQKVLASYRSMWNEAALFICVSQYVRRKAMEAGFPPEKLRVHYIGIDLEKFSASGSRPRPNSILFVSRLVQKKGCEYLLRAMEIVQRASPSAELSIIGDGLLRAPLEALAKQLNIRCRFLGAQPAEAIRDALKSARVFCVPSVTADSGDSEGFGMVFAEAQAMGVPVVSFEHGGIPEVVRQGITGILAPERDYASLAEGILGYLTDDRLWQDAREQGRKWIQERFNITTQTAELETIYAETITRCRAAGGLS